ncbi:hypothetical protein COU57_05040 [Candidatus Pacearchaeota archaeon CG10_big_fil_rev_8_21_14_0_10_32_14]|nr:MAG: hypothetical protein COU57_05040 [Candidatus Pacearchaeota archaeon CG10_big_fil_rev_8_21_14_0_10_32_14]
MLEIVRDLEGRSRRERREIVSKWIEYFGLEYICEDYISFLGIGQNIIIPCKKEKRIAIGSHYDAVEGSPGANDNGSAVAVTLELARRLQDFDGEIGVTYFFFDQEEEGLIGSSSYLHLNKPKDILGLYNLELVGLGKNIALWPVKPDERGTLLQTFEEVAKNKGRYTFRFPQPVINTADHESFRRYGINDAFTITTITDEDLKLAPEFVNPDLSRREIQYVMQRSDVFRHYHQKTDKAKHLCEESLEMVTGLLYDSILAINSNPKKQEVVNVSV